MQPPLCARNSAKLTSLLDTFTCVHCKTPHPATRPTNGPRVYDYSCATCGAEHLFWFRRTAWRWRLLHGFVHHEREWRTLYDPADNRTFFWRIVDADPCIVDEHEFGGYVPPDRFTRLLVFS